MRYRKISTMTKLMMLTLTIVVAHAVSIKWARRKENCMVNYEFQISEIFGEMNARACLVSCQIRTGCESVSWYQDNTSCLLFNKNVLEDKRQQFTSWQALPTWTTYSKVVYPVVRMINPDENHTEMDFDVAVQTCLDQFSTIASKDDLLHNRELGMDKCYCGWLSNGLNGLVTQHEDSCPNYEFSTDVTYCNSSRAVAWCKLG